MWQDLDKRKVEEFFAGDFIAKQGLIGFDGGKLKELCDVSLHVKTPVGEFGPVEDIHMILDHLITTWFCRSSSLSL